MGLAWVVSFLVALAGTQAREFKIDYEQDTFLMDGQPFQYVSGSMHYFRCPQQLWRDRLRKMRDAGLNAVSTYIEWNQHEKTPGNYDFSGDLNFTDFIQTAAQEGLHVIVRPGPYICAERDMGGLPPWLLKDPAIRLRTSDPRYTQPVGKWMEILLKMLGPLLYGNGGPVIMLQVENEYGSYPACDKNHLLWLRDLYVKYVGNAAVLFTTDGAAPSYLKCGKIPGVYATVDFGSGYNVSYAFSSQRAYEPKGPLVNSEYYPGWLTHWGEARPFVDTARVQATLREMLQRKANINFYMFHGGTNFGFTAGANFGKAYQSDITSYDYDAPLTEAGDLTQKYYDIKKVLAEFFPHTKRHHHKHQRTAPKGDYGSLHLNHIASLLSPTVREILGKSTTSVYPPSFEALGSYYGYVLYEKSLQTTEGEPLAVKTTDIRDRGLVLQKNLRVGTFSREYSSKEVAYLSKPSETLSILVENLGRINYGAYNNDTKGLGNVTINGQLVTNWNVTAFSLDDISGLLSCSAECLAEGELRFYGADFTINSNTTNEYLPDTFLDVSTLKKGLVFINGHNLGRYWTSRGPQLTIYVPGVWLKKSPQLNTIVIFDEKADVDSLDVQFTKVPIWSTKKSKPSPSAVQV